MIVNVLEPKGGVLLDPACGSGGMFIQSGDFVNQAGMNANSAMTFYGQEKVEYNAQLCQMNMAVHGLTGVIRSGDEANTFYHDAHGRRHGLCDGQPAVQRGQGESRIVRERRAAAVRHAGRE